MHQQSCDTRDMVASNYNQAIESVSRDEEHARFRGERNTTTAGDTMNDRLLQEMRKHDDRKVQVKRYSSHAERMRKRQDKHDKPSR